MYDEDYRLIEAVNATVLPKGFVRTSNLNIVLVMKRKKTLESDAMNHSNNFCHPAHDDEQQPQQQQCSNTQSSSSRKHGRYIQIRARTSYSSVQLSSISYNLSGSGTLVVKAHTRCLTKRVEKRRYKNK